MNSKLSILIFSFYMRITHLHRAGHLCAQANRQVVDKTGNLHRQLRALRKRRELLKLIRTYWLLAAP